METLQAKSTKLNPLESWEQFDKDTTNIQIALNELQEKYTIPTNGISAHWIKGKFSLLISFTELRGV